MKNGVTIDTLKINRGIGESTIDMDGSSVIKTVDARSDVDIRGTGTVNTINKRTAHSNAFYNAVRRNRSNLLITARPCYSFVRFIVRYSNCGCQLDFFPNLHAGRRFIQRHARHAAEKRDNHADAGNP